MKDRTAPHAWQWRSSGALSANRNMAEDVAAIAEFNSGRDTPLGRWYKWESECVTYGSRQREEFVRSVVPGNPDIARRPTGGGICFHQPDDLALSLFMPRALADVDVIRQWRDVLCRTVQNYQATSRSREFPSLAAPCPRPPHQRTATLPPSPPPSARDAFGIPGSLGGMKESHQQSIWCDERFVPGELVDGAEKVLALSARIGKNYYLLQANIRGVRREEKENFRIQVAGLIPAFSTRRGVRHGFPEPARN